MARRKSSKKSLKGAVKRPGALTARAKRSSRSITAQARHDKVHGTTLQKRQASFYLNIAKGGKRKSTRRKKK
jgi:hypothetical protein